MSRFNPIFPQTDDPSGIYVHVPFCLGRCNYCGFVTNPHDEAGEARYVGSVIREVELRSASVAVDTLYFGGGTPSLLPPKDIGRLIEACRQRFSFGERPEITLEINPATLGRDGFEELRTMGVNRASLGVQSLQDHELSAMGRLHSAAEAVTAFEHLRKAKFDNVSVDLVAGYPGQTLESVRRTLREAVNLGPDHVSVYLLERKPGTKLHDFISSGEAPMPDDDLAADLYEEICSFLESAGYEHYEISNFAREGRVSRHNLKYWEDSPYIGLGSGAHGMTGRARYANLENLERYEAELSQGRLPTATFTELLPETRFKDALIMGLRLTKGLDLDYLSVRYSVDARAFVLGTIADLEDAGLFVLGEAVLRFTPKGRLLSNIVFSRWL